MSEKQRNLEEKLKEDLREQLRKQREQKRKAEEDQIMEENRLLEGQDDDVELELTIGEEEELLEDETASLEELREKVKEIEEEKNRVLKEQKEVEEELEKLRIGSERGKWSRQWKLKINRWKIIQNLKLTSGTRPRPRGAQPLAET